MPALTLVWGQGHGSNTIEGPETRFAKGIDDYKGKGISWFSVWVWSETTDFVNFVTVWQNQRQIGLILAFQSSPSSGDGPQLGFCSTFPKFPNLKWPSSAIKLASFPMFSPFLWFRPLDTQHRAIARYVATSLRTRAFVEIGKACRGSQGAHRSEQLPPPLIRACILQTPRLVEAPCPRPMKDPWLVVEP